MYNKEAKKRGFPQDKQMAAIIKLEQLADGKNVMRYMQSKKETHNRKIEEIIIERTIQ